MAKLNITKKKKCRLSMAQEAEEVQVIMAQEAGSYSSAELGFKV
jgi:hypothetical protein